MFYVGREGRPNLLKKLKEPDTDQQLRQLPTPAAASWAHWTLSKPTDQRTAITLSGLGPLRNSPDPTAFRTESRTGNGRAQPLVIARNHISRLSRLRREKTICSP